MLHVFVINNRSKINKACILNGTEEPMYTCVRARVCIEVVVVMGWVVVVVVVVVVVNT
jgi:hypothetical protein